jgi:hypothetical protein
MAIGGDGHHRLHDAGRAFRLGDVGDEASVAGLALRYPGFWHVPHIAALMWASCSK